MNDGYAKHSPIEFSASFANTKEIAKLIVDRLQPMDNYNPINIFLKWIIDPNVDHTELPTEFVNSDIEELYTRFRMFESQHAKQTTKERLKKIFPDNKDEFIEVLTKAFLNDQPIEVKYFATEAASLASATMELFHLKNKILDMAGVISTYEEKVTTLERQALNNSAAFEAVKAEKDANIAELEKAVLKLKLYIHTEKEVIMTLPEIKNGELAELFAKIEALETKVKEQEKRLELITVQELRPIPGSFNVFKVVKLPTDTVPNSMYVVGDSAARKFDIYFTGLNGEIYSLNKNSDEKQHVVVARTLELSDPVAVKRWLTEARCIAADIAEYLKATNVGSTARDIELEKRNSISQLLDATTKELEEISAAAEHRLRELEQTKIAHNSVSGAHSGATGNKVHTWEHVSEPGLCTKEMLGAVKEPKPQKVQNSAASGCVARTEQSTGPSLTEMSRIHETNRKELIRQTHQKYEAALGLSGWDALVVIAKERNIDLKNLYAYLTSDGKIEIRKHEMFPSKEYLDQIGKPSTSLTNALTEHPMSKTALVHNVDILFMTIQGHEQCVDAVEIGKYNEVIRDRFFAIERELAMRTESSVRELAHSGYKVNVNYIPIPDAAPLCSRMFQIGRDGRNLSFAFYDSIPIRLAPQPAALSNSDGSDLTWQAAPLRQA